MTHMITGWVSKSKVQLQEDTPTKVVIQFKHNKNKAKH